jgi:hypothetical protein
MEEQMKKIPAHSVKLSFAGFLWILCRGMGFAVELISRRNLLSVGSLTYLMK